MAAVACMVSASAQTVYNYFDAADVDANGWLWFDTQAKIDKYVGWGNKYKIQLQSATYEDADGQYPEPYGDPTAIGWNAAGEQGEGAKTGAIILPEGSYLQMVQLIRMVELYFSNFLIALKSICIFLPMPPLFA